MILLQSALHLLEDLGSLDFRRPRASAPSVLGHLLSDNRAVGIALAVACQLPADRGAVTAEGLGDPLLRLQSRVPFRYLFPLFHGKVGHRWESVRMACLTTTIRASQRTFSQDQSPCLSTAACAFQNRQRRGAKPWVSSRGTSPR